MTVITPNELIAIVVLEICAILVVSVKEAIEGKK